jgi:hypothetical protein
VPGAGFLFFWAAQPHLSTVIAGLDPAIHTVTVPKARLIVLPRNGMGLRIKSEDDGKRGTASQNVL